MPCAVCVNCRSLEKERSREREEGEGELTEKDLCEAIKAENWTERFRSSVSIDCILPSKAVIRAPNKTCGATEEEEREPDCGTELGEETEGRLKEAAEIFEEGNSSKILSAAAAVSERERLGKAERIVQTEGGICSKKRGRVKDSSSCAWEGPKRL